MHIILTKWSLRQTYIYMIFSTCTCLMTCFTLFSWHQSTSGVDHHPLAREKSFSGCHCQSVHLTAQHRYDFCHIKWLTIKIFWNIFCMLVCSHQLGSIQNHTIHGYYRIKLFILYCSATICLYQLISIPAYLHEPTCTCTYLPFSSHSLSCLLTVASWLWILG